ncbi:MAG: NADPH:quinone reductase [Pseudomonadales bacterium]|nr:quinone oxidoreductase [Pseudomonadales bacterium]NIX09401.1 NADPH:quinone reductase [Pseudomonadales bacterium]
MVGVYRIHGAGGPEVLRWESEDLPDPTGELVTVRHTAIGLNYIDTYHRSGLYPLPYPTRLGVEAAGVVEAVGEAVADLQEGDRVAYAGGMGAYAEANNVPASRLIRIPTGLADELVAACLLKGLTACYLLTRTYPLAASDTMLLHAAAGGTGLIMCQWARHIGATVIGTVGSPAKAEMARQNGADHTILYREEDVVARVKEITEGRGVNVAYDSVGRDTYQVTLESLAPLGMFVSFGNASGKVPPVDPQDLVGHGSLFFTRPSLAHYAARSEDLQAMADQLLTLVADGTVKIHINQRYPLADLIKAHQDLESRSTTGSTIILP